LAQGRGSSTVDDTPYVPRSRSRETTFQRDLTDWEAVRSEVVAIAARVAEDVAAEGRDVVRMVVKLRFVPFTTRTHGAALPVPSQDRDVLEVAALRAFAGFDERRAVRLVGVRAEFG
jgi:DNA polymerase-4